jgi:hypothetical protein
MLVLVLMLMLMPSDTEPGRKVRLWRVSRVDLQANAGLGRGGTRSFTARSKLSEESALISVWCDGRE